ncbi:phage tail protein [Rhodocyclus gracilis]|uniref:phage tail protein n=1 Tax=Rhodocyclus gracilis TaxID=2929842 RepID=UPI0030F479F0
MGISTPPPDRPLFVWELTATPPYGYIKANGALLSRTAYAWLFNRIGTTYGAGDGSTTFSIPDLRGEFLRGLDDGRGVDTGRLIGSAQSGAIQSHSHTLPIQLVQCSSGNANMTAISGGPINSGATGGTETRSRNVAVLPCIAYMP